MFASVQDVLTCIISVRIRYGRRDPWKNPSMSVWLQKKHVFFWWQHKNRISGHDKHWSSSRALSGCSTGGFLHRLLIDCWAPSLYIVSYVGNDSGSTIRTLLHGKINPKDWQVLSLGDVGFLLFFRLVSGDYGKPCDWLVLDGWLEVLDLWPFGVDSMIGRFCSVFRNSRFVLAFSWFQIVWEIEKIDIW